MTKSYTVTSSVHCIKTLYCMNRQFRVCYHDGGRPSLLFNRLRSICQKRRVNAGAGAGRLVAYCALGGIDLPAAGHRSPKVVSWPTAELDLKARGAAFGHRGFTHSLLAVFGALTLFYLKVPDSWIVPADALQGWCWAISATFSPICSPPPVCRCCGPVAGASGCRSLRRARAISSNAPLCMALFVYAVWMPQTLADNSAIRWSSGVINSLQITFNRFISHQSGR